MCRGTGRACRRFGPSLWEVDLEQAEESLCDPAKAGRASCGELSTPLCTGHRRRSWPGSRCLPARQICGTRARESPTEYCPPACICILLFSLLADLGSDKHALYSKVSKVVLFRKFTAERYSDSFQADSLLDHDHLWDEPTRDASAPKRANARPNFCRTSMLHMQLQRSSSPITKG